ncbi:expressed unknown protein [Seminavis robusta]|uniref:SnoaL-like domain-containing protein n=1 Tax=Seminavis robusta TaxID=568900 RepID=A0A9N8DBR9_9STRA|nr:expressed unknown protein [Seminavis robusta]|eukprot:Sro10_g007850.1 n/a (252) ;mRNA; r:24311-25066
MNIKHIFQPKKWTLTSKQPDAEDPAVQKKVGASKNDTMRCSATTFSSDVSMSTHKSKTSRSSSKSGGRSRKSSKSSKSGNRPHQISKIPESIVEYQSPNEKVIIAFLKAWNNHSNFEETLSFFDSKDTPVKLEDGKSLTGEIFAAERQKVYKSFPDITFTYESLKEDGHGVVVVDELHVCGTHTGEPYGFAHFPPAPTSNRRVVNDPERLWFKVKDGKVVLMQVISLGDVTGPPGLYVQVGGKLEMPPPGN